MVILLLAGAAACSTQRPVLSPNAHLVNVGADAAKRDTEACMELADVNTRERGGSAGDVAADSAASSVVGAAAGAAGGAVVGNAAQGAAAGAAGGAVASLTRSLMQRLFRSRAPEPGYREFVESCLRRKGYEPAGWN